MNCGLRHDGAIVWFNTGEVEAASMIQSLTVGALLVPEAGSRHIAARAISQKSDAVVVTVSATGGIVRAFCGGVMIPLGDAQDVYHWLEERLREFVIAPVIESFKSENVLVDCRCDLQVLQERMYNRAFDKEAKGSGDQDHNDPFVILQDHSRERRLTSAETFYFKCFALRLQFERTWRGLEVSSTERLNEADMWTLCVSYDRQFDSMLDALGKSELPDVQLHSRCLRVNLQMDRVYTVRFCATSIPYRDEALNRCRSYLKSVGPDVFEVDNRVLAKYYYLLAGLETEYSENSHFSSSAEAEFTKVYFFGQQAAKLFHNSGSLIEALVSHAVNLLKLLSKIDTSNARNEPMLHLVLGEISVLEERKRNFDGSNSHPYVLFLISLVKFDALLCTDRFSAHAGRLSSDTKDAFSEAERLGELCDSATRDTLWNGNPRRNSFSVLEMRALCREQAS